MLAYLDAGTGSLIATVVVGGTAAAGVAVRSARAKVTGALTRKRKGAPADEATPATTDETATADATVGEAPAGATVPEPGTTPAG